MNHGRKIIGMVLFVVYVVAIIIVVNSISLKIEPRAQYELTSENSYETDNVGKSTMKSNRFLTIVKVIGGGILLVGGMFIAKLCYDFNCEGTVVGPYIGVAERNMLESEVLRRNGLSSDASSESSHASLEPSAPIPQVAGSDNVSFLIEEPFNVQIQAPSAPPVDVIPAVHMQIRSSDEPPSYQEVTDITHYPPHSIDNTRVAARTDSLPTYSDVARHVNVEIHSPEAANIR